MVEKLRFLDHPDHSPKSRAATDEPYQSGRILVSGTNKTPNFQPLTACTGRGIGRGMGRNNSATRKRRRAELIDDLRVKYPRFGARVHQLITDAVDRAKRTDTELTEADIHEQAGGIVNINSLHRLLNHAPQSSPYDRLEAIAAAFGYRIDVQLRRIGDDDERRERMAALRAHLER